MHNGLARINPADIDTEVRRAVPKLGPDVVRFRYTVQDDTTGDPAIYFRIVITDSAASSRDALRQSTEAIENRVTSEINPYLRWGLFPYFSFRGESEQALMHEAEWS